MKIIRNGSFYVQARDLIFIHYSLGILPTSLKSKFFGKKKDKIDEYDEYDFIKIQDKEEIGFLRRQNYILDYNYYNILSTETITEMACEQAEKTQIHADYINEVIDKFGMNDFVLGDAFHTYKMLSYQLLDFETLLAVKCGEMPINLAEDNSHQFIKTRVAKMLQKVI
ncbi:MAG: hypothetical protein J1F35_04685 [Erysipelotrichales bacterium]|nr:hypothetical protein [Erysipelotrichales bacterium]